MALAFDDAVGRFDGLDVIISSFREAMHLAPVIHSLRDDFKRNVRIISIPSLEHDLEIMLNHLDLASDIQWRIFGTKDQTSVIFGEIQMLLGELWSSRKPAWLLFFGHENFAFSSISSAFQNKIPSAHIIDANHLEQSEPQNTRNLQLRKSINSMSDIHFAPNIQIRNSLIVEGVNEKNVYTVGSTLPDASLFLTRRLFASCQVDEIVSQNFQNALNSLDPNRTILVDINDQNIHDKFEFDFILSIFNIFRSYKIIFVHAEQVSVQSMNSEFSVNHVIHLESVTQLQKCFLLSRICCAISDSIETLEQGIAFGVRGILLRSETERFDLVCSGWVTLVGKSNSLLLERFLSELCQFNKKKANRFFLSEHKSQLACCGQKIAQALTIRTNENAEKLKTSLQPQQAQ